MAKKIQKKIQKKINKNSSVKKVGFKTNQKKKGSSIKKDCTVKLNRMSVSHWLNGQSTYSLFSQH